MIIISRFIKYPIWIQYQRYRDMVRGCYPSHFHRIILILHPGNLFISLIISLKIQNNSLIPHLLSLSSSDKTVKVWELRNRDALHTFSEHNDQVFGVDYNHDGKLLASVSGDRSLIVYECPT